MPYHPELKTTDGRYRMLMDGSEVSFRFKKTLFTGYVRDQRMFYNDIVYVVDVDGELWTTRASAVEYLSDDEHENAIPSVPEVE